MAHTSPGHAAGQHLPGNLRFLREGKGMSQSALAEAMKGRGWPWYQTTVARVEGGTQPVGLGETVDLALVLGATVDRLTRPTAEATAAALVDLAADDVQRAWNDVANAVKLLVVARSRGESTLKKSGGSTLQMVREACAELESVLESATLEDAAAEGYDRYESQEAP